MTVRLFNTYSRQIEDFAPIDPQGKSVKMYTCGPTVYNHAHIGNFRAYVFEDILQRHLEAQGYTVERVMNLTDVDDKTIRGARASGRRLADFTQIYKDGFFRDLETLRIKPAAHFPAATEPRYIQRMIAMIGELEAKGIAYQAEDRSVYFRLARFADYGKLAHLNLDELRPSGRVRHDEYEKESIGDFALWKAWDEADGEVSWESPWGLGRPGWHIECSAMAMEILGPELDIHCGGVDNIFPHHEAEIAQSECCTGKKFVRYWLHCAHLMVDGQKMAKSLGNFYTLRDLLEKGYTGREIRYVLLTVHYRLPLNFTFAGLEASRSALGRIDQWVTRLSELKLHGTGRCEIEEGTGLAWDESLGARKKGFFAALDDDLNISGAMGQVFDLIRESNAALDRGKLTSEQIDCLLGDWDSINRVLCLQSEEREVPAEVLVLVEQREVARAEKDWKGSDDIRAKIVALGWSVKDTKTGPEVGFLIK